MKSRKRLTCAFDSFRGSNTQVMIGNFANLKYCCVSGRIKFFSTIVEVNDLSCSIVDKVK